MKYYLLAGGAVGRPARREPDQRTAESRSRSGIPFLGRRPHGGRRRQGQPAEALPRNLVLRHRAGAEKPRDHPAANAGMSGRRGGIRPRRLILVDYPRLQHEDGPLGQRTRHPHLLLHRPEGLGVARMAGEGDPQIRRSALHHLPFERTYFPGSTASNPFSRATRWRTPSKPAAYRFRRPTSSAAGTDWTNVRSSPCWPAAAGAKSARTCR